MAISEWVLDTQILEIASTGEHPLALDAAALLCAIRDRHLLAIDCEGEIVHEYDPYLRPGTLAEQWWTQMNQRGKLRYHSHQLKQRQRRALAALRFDPSDWKFVGVACRTASHLLVAEEPDYWDPQVADYLVNHMHIVLLRTNETATAAGL
jgi:hypothetical protein